MSVNEEATATNTSARSDTRDLAKQLDQLRAKATKEYSLKNYNAAAEVFSEAAELQDRINGEMSPNNADLLYQYGRCLYHVAVANSDVLGGKVASTEEPKRKKRKVAQVEIRTNATSGAADGEVISNALKTGEQKLAEEVVEAVVEDKDGMKKEGNNSSKAYFNITGDENWTDSEEEEEEEDGEAADAEAEEEEDDFATAYEILDVARVLLRRQLDALSASSENDTTRSTEVRQIRERLADTHDLQAEISLENERFQEAINDGREALALKLDLYSEDSNLIAEAHYKLSLALEFASVTSIADDDATGEPKQPQQIDDKLRDEAILHTEKAIASCTLRISKLESSTEEQTEQQRKASVKEVRSLIQEMQQRLVDLRNPAVALDAGGNGSSDPLQGMLGGILGQSREEQQRMIAEATRGARDLSGLVRQRKKVKVDEEGGESTGEGEGKRKRQVDDEQVAAGTNGKKVKFEE